jgi:hypothetical protein
MGQAEGATLHSVIDMALALTARDFGQVQFRDKYGRMQVALTFISQKEQEARQRRSSKPAPQVANAVQEAAA